MRHLRLSLVLFAIGFVSLSCGSDVSRDYLASNTPSFSIAPPDSDSLQLSLVDQIDDSGNHHYQIQGNLSNSQDSSGQHWSDILGNSFNIRIGNQNFLLSVASTSGTDSTFNFGPTSIPNGTVSSLFNQNIRVYLSDGTSASNQASTPAGLNDPSSIAPTLSNRILESCVLTSSDPNPSLSWNGQSSNPLNIQLGSNPLFALSIPDNGFWQPTKNFFLTFYSASQLTQADQTSTATNFLIEPLKIQRTLTSSLIVSRSGHLDRSLSLFINFEVDENTNVRYVGGCP